MTEPGLQADSLTCEQMRPSSGLLVCRVFKLTVKLLSLLLLPSRAQATVKGDAEGVQWLVRFISA